MNEACLQRALKIIEALTPEDIAKSLTEYGIKFSYVEDMHEKGFDIDSYLDYYEDDVDEEFGCY